MSIIDWEKVTKQIKLSLYLNSYSQAQVANKLGFSASTFSRRMQNPGRFSMIEFWSVCAILGLDPKEVILLSVK